MIKFFVKTLIVSGAIVAVPIVFMKRIKKLANEGFFDCNSTSTSYDEDEDENNPKSHIPFKFNMY